MLDLTDREKITMGLFGKKEPEQVQVAGLTLRCEICKHDRFWQRQAQLNTAVATFFSFDWANARPSPWAGPSGRRTRRTDSCSTSNPPGGRPGRA